MRAPGDTVVKTGAAQTDGAFQLGKPELVCRWRLAGARLPLENRHLRALGRRHVNSGEMDKALVAWAKQHIEWTLADGGALHPDGVLMLIVDESGRAAMTVGPHKPLACRSTSALIARARESWYEGLVTGVSPESVWIVSEGTLVWGIPEDSAPSGATSLVEDLARTLGIPVERSKSLLDDLDNGELGYDEFFLVSDEHGIVRAADAPGSEGERFQRSYGRLLDQVRRGRLR